MKVLMVSGDRNVLTEGTGAYERLALQRAQVEALDVFVWPQTHSLVALWRAAGRRHYDVVTTQDPFWRGVVGLVVAWRTRAKLNVQVHTDLSVQPLLRHILAQVVLRHADSVRVVSEKIQKQVERFGVRVPIHILPIYVELDRFKAAQRLPHAQKTMLWIGRFEEEKNPLEAIEVLKKVREEGVDAKLVMVGSGSLMGQVTTHVAALPVELPGWHVDIVPFLEMSDVVLCTSSHESWGASMIEALAAGVPVVAPDVGVAREAGAFVVERNKLAEKVVEVLKSGVRGELTLQLLGKEEWARAWASTLV